MRKKQRYKWERDGGWPWLSVWVNKRVGEPPLVEMGMRLYQLKGDEFNIYREKDDGSQGRRISIRGWWECESALVVNGKIEEIGYTVPDVGSFYTRHRLQRDAIAEAEAWVIENRARIYKSMEQQEREQVTG